MALVVKGISQYTDSQCQGERWCVLDTGERRQQVSVLVDLGSKGKFWAKVSLLMSQSLELVNIALSTAEGTLQM